jgi:hypothetical protein
MLSPLCCCISGTGGGGRGDTGDNIGSFRDRFFNHIAIKLRSFFTGKKEVIN